MDAGVIRSLLRASPFEPFTVSLTCRSSYDITRPELAEVTMTGDVMHLKRPDGSWHAMIALRHVVSITFPDTPTIR